MAASSMPSVVCESLYFKENGAGTYTGSVVIPADSVLLDILVHAEALWTAATSAALTVGDVASTNGFFDAVDLKAADLLAGESLSFSHTGAQNGADVQIFTQTVNTAVIDDPALQHVKRRVLAMGAERTLQAKVISVGAGTAGRTKVMFVYTRPVNESVVTQ